MVTMAGRADQSYSKNVTGSNLPQYELSIKILPDAHRLEASGTIKLPASDSVRERLQLALSELMDDFRVEVLQPSTSAGAAKIEKKERPWAGVPGWGTNEYAIRPTRPIPAGESVLLKFSYAGGGEKTSFVFYLGPEASFGAGTSTAWYPEVEEPSDEGGRLRGLKGMGVLNFSVPLGYTVIASGIERNSLDESAKGQFRFDVNQPTSFSFAAGRYSVNRRNGTVPMAVYLLRPRQNIEKYLDGSSRILDVLVREFGPNPYGKFALVEVPDEQAGNAGFNGASQEGLILTSSSSLDAEFNPNHYGHEISHQWWGNLIRNKGPHGYLMLDEAMAQYGALVSIDALEGPDAAARFRRRGDPGFGIEQSGLAFLALAAADLDNELSDLPPSQRYSLYIANSKGFLVYDLLSRTIGREKFRQILRAFTHEHAFQRVTLEEFLAAIGKGARSDLTWFYKQWFERKGAPDWQMTWTQEGATLRGIITQSPPYYQATVEIQAKSSDCQQIARSVEIRGPRTEFTWPVKFQVKSVVLDPDFKVLHWTPEYRAEGTALVPYWQGLVKWQEGKSAEAQQILTTALAQAPVPDLYAVHFMLEEGWARVLQGDKSLSKEKKFSEMKVHLEKALASPVRRPDRLPWVYYFLATVAKQLNDEATLRRAVEGAITSDAALGGRTGWGSAARALLPEGRH
jgi:hypothetical protein